MSIIEDKDINGQMTRDLAFMDEALVLAAKAAELGVSEAMNYLGLMYEAGDGVAKDYKKAVNWFLNAIRADKNNRFAAYNMGRMYYNGHGIEKNYDKAYTYFDTAAYLSYEARDITYAKCTYFIGCIFIEHYKKYKDSIMYFMIAAYVGNLPGAWHNLGWLAARGALPAGMYDGKERIHLDITARWFYEQAANLGYLPAMDELGRLNVYYQDIKTARFWLTKAAEKGYEPSIKRLKLLKTADVLNRISGTLPSSGSSNISSRISNYHKTSAPIYDTKNKSNALFRDIRGNLCTPGSPFYDAKDNICEWGSPFYDFKGNYCTPGNAFYDSKGNYITWGSPFYDAKGNYIVP